MVSGRTWYCPGSEQPRMSLLMKAASTVLRSVAELRVSLCTTQTRHTAYQLSCNLVKLIIMHETLCPTTRLKRLNICACCCVYWLDCQQLTAASAVVQPFSHLCWHSNKYFILSHLIQCNSQQYTDITSKTHTSAQHYYINSNLGPLYCTPS